MVHPRNAIFTGHRIWDHATERGSSGVEIGFQKLTDTCLNGKHEPFNRDECQIISAFYGLLLSRQDVIDTPRSSIVVHGVTGLDKSKYQDEMERIESHGGHTISQAGNVAVIDGLQINGLSVFKGMDRFLLDNPDLEWVIAHAPTDTEFVVPDRFSFSIGGTQQHYVAIPITPGLAFIVPNAFQCLGNLTQVQVRNMNSIAKRISLAYYFASNLSATL